MVPAFGLGILIMLEETHCMRFAGQGDIPLIVFRTFWPQKVPKTPAADTAACSADDGRQRRNRGDFSLHRPYGMQQNLRQ